MPTRRFSKLAGAKVAEVSSWEQGSTGLEGAARLPLRTATGCGQELRSVLNCVPPRHNASGVTR